MHSLYNTSGTYLTLPVFPYTYFRLGKLEPVIPEQLGLLKLYYSLPYNSPRMGTFQDA